VDPFDPKDLDAAAGHWPEVHLDGQVFHDYVQARITPSPSGEPAPPEVSRTPEQLATLYLCCACVNGSEAACVAFQRVYLGVIRNAIARIFPDRQWIDEVTARVLARLLVGPEPRLTRYSGRGDLSAWLKVASTRAAIDAKRSRPERDEEPLSSSREAAMSMSPESLVFCRTHAKSILDALTLAISALDKKQRNLLRLNYADGLNIEEIGALYGVHRATVARWLQQARSGIESAVHEDLRVRRRLDAADVRSLIQGARPYLEESLRKLLGEANVDDDETIDELAPSD
jgi:RNA polymerase sigma-70 factor (ECF subfamily)